MDTSSALLPARPAAPRAAQGAPTQLRLALVCYGGVSLAVYMHGITKELHKLVAASRRFDALGDVDAENPFPGDSERVYFEALRALARAGAACMDTKNLLIAGDAWFQVRCDITAIWTVIWVWMISCRSSGGR